MADGGRLMAGKRGVVFGVANNRSIAWGITKAVTDQGAEVALTYQGDAIKKRVEPLAQEVGSKLVLPCDVTDEATVEARVQGALATAWGSIDFLVHAVAFSDKEELDGRYVDTTQGELHPDAADLLLLLHRARQARRDADAEWRLAAHPHLLRRREGDAAL